MQAWRLGAISKLAIWSFGAIAMFLCFPHPKQGGMWEVPLKTQLPING